MPTVNIATGNRKNAFVQHEMMRWFFSITVAFALIFGAVGQAIAAPTAHAQKIELVSTVGE